MINKSNVYFPLNKTISTESVTSVNGKTGAVELNSSDVNALPNTTKLSDLNNDVGYITGYTETDPTVPSWAKTPDKPNYNFNEITNKPTTLSGYGITDSATATQGMKADTAIQSIEKGAPSGVATLNSNGKLISSQLDTSSNTYKIGLLNLSEEVQTAMAGTAPVISSVTDGSLTTEKYADSSITYNKISTQLYKNIENVFDNMIDVISAEDGYYYNNAGVKEANSLFSTVTNIRVVPGETYTISKFGNPQGFGSRGCFFQSNGTFIEAFPTPVNGETVITAPANAAYCNVNFLTPYKNLVTMTKGDGTVSISKIPTLGAFNTDYLIDGNLNLYDETKAISGGYYNGSGVWTENANFISTHLIPVNPGEEYVMSNMNALVTFWDINETFVSSISGSDMNRLLYVTIPENVSYMRFEFTTNIRYSVIIKAKKFPDVFKKIPWNLYDFDNEQLGGYYGTNGVWTPATILKTSAYIPVVPGLKYLPSILTLSGVMNQTVTFWDSNKTFISGINISEPVVAPANSAYACFTFWSNDKIPMVIQGENMPELFIPKTITSPNLSISKSNLDKFALSKYIIDGNWNLWNENNTTIGYYDNSGVYVNDSNFRVSELIPVKPGEKYPCNKTKGIATWWNSNKVFLSNSTSELLAKGFVTAPSNAAYLRINVKKADTDVLLCEGKELPTYGISSPGKTIIPNLLTATGWSGKKWVSYGDSITYQGKWQPYIASEFNLVHVNLGVGSTCIANYGSNPMCGDDRITLVKNENPSIVTILGGANDLVQFGTNLKMGTNAEFAKVLAEKDKTTFYGAYSYIIENLLTWKPTLRILIMGTTWAHNDGTAYSSIYTYTDFSNACKSIAQYYGLPFIDLHGECGFNKFTLGSSPYNIYSSDNIHPNDAGGKRISEVVINKIKNLNPIN